MNLAHLSDLEIANQATLQPIGDIAIKQVYQAMH